MSQSFGGGGGVPAVLRWMVKVMLALPGFRSAVEGTST
jgi:hypothetical protein